MKKLKGKTVVVVGATGGIGRVLTSEFYSAGANVVLVARTLEKLWNLQSTLGTNRVLTVQTDATVVSDVKSLFQKATKKFGIVDAVVISAGTWERLSVNNLPEEALESSKKLFQSIFLPSMMVGFVAQEYFRKQGYGLIANISSHAAVRPWLQGNLSYGSMKAAARQYMLALRHELAGTGVTVTDIQPAIVNTDEAGHLLDTEQKRNKAVQPEEIAMWIAQQIGKKKVPAEKLFDSDVVL